MRYFIHGYESSPSGEKALLFQRTLGALPIQYRTGPPRELRIPDAVDRIATALAGDPDVSLIGSSLGGYLAAVTALRNPSVTHLALLNPATIPPGTDLSAIVDMPPSILASMVNPSLFSEKLSASILIIRGTQDTVVPARWVAAFARAQHAKVHFLPDDHRLSHSLEMLPQMIEAFFSHG